MERTNNQSQNICRDYGSLAVVATANKKKVQSGDCFFLFHFKENRLAMRGKNSVLRAEGFIIVSSVLCHYVHWPAFLLSEQIYQSFLMFPLFLLGLNLCIMMRANREKLKAA